MTQYTRGRVTEYKVRDLLLSAGYWVCRAAGSKGAADLVAIQRGYVALVQVKAGARPISVAEWNGLFDLAAELGVIPILAECPPRKPVTLSQLIARRVPHSPHRPLVEWLP